MKKDLGFTFIETLIVLAIILILSAGIGISASTYIERSRKSAAISEIAILTNALYTYYLDCGTFPSQVQGLHALWEKPVFHPVPKNWQGPYVNRKPGTDPWGNDYVYSNTNEAGLPFSIMSLGSDGLDTSEVENDNIYSWK